MYVYFLEQFACSARSGYQNNECHVARMRRLSVCTQGNKMEYLKSGFKSVLGNQGGQTQPSALETVRTAWKFTKKRNHVVNCD